MSSRKHSFTAKRENNLLSPCFEIGPDVELKDEPSNGEEYLLKVINEREKLSSVIKCNKDYSVFARNQSCFVKELPNAKVPDNLKPTIEWQNIQVADFAESRKYVSRVMKKQSNWPPDVGKFGIHIGDKKDCKEFIETRDATLSYVICARQVSIDRGLKVLIKIIDRIEPGDMINHRTGQWIYSLLACTRQPLVSDTISILRDLARKCAKVRSHLNPEAENSKQVAAPLNLFICLISRYFGQYDLAD